MPFLLPAPLLQPLRRQSSGVPLASGAGAGAGEAHDAARDQPPSQPSARKGEPSRSYAAIGGPLAVGGTGSGREREREGEGERELRRELTRETVGRKSVGGGGAGEEREGGVGAGSPKTTSERKRKTPRAALGHTHSTPLVPTAPHAHASSPHLPLAPPAAAAAAAPPPGTADRDAAAPERPREMYLAKAPRPGKSTSSLPLALTMGMLGTAGAAASSTHLVPGPLGAAGNAPPAAAPPPPPPAAGNPADDPNTRLILPSSYMKARQAGGTGGIDSLALGAPIASGTGAGNIVRDKARYHGHSLASPPVISVQRQLPLGAVAAAVVGAGRDGAAAGGMTEAERYRAQVRAAEETMAGDGAAPVQGDEASDGADATTRPRKKKKKKRKPREVAVEIVGGSAEVGGTAPAPAAGETSRAGRRGTRRAARRNGSGRPADEAGLGVARHASMLRRNVWDDVPDPATSEDSGSAPVAADAPPPFPYPTPSTVRAPPAFDSVVGSATGPDGGRRSPPPSFDQAMHLGIIAGGRASSPAQTPAGAMPVVQEAAASDQTASDVDSVPSASPTPSESARQVAAMLPERRRAHEDRQAWLADTAGGLSLEDRIKRMLQRKAHAAEESGAPSPKVPAEAHEAEPRITVNGATQVDEGATRPLSREEKGKAKEVFFDALQTPSGNRSALGATLSRNVSIRTDTTYTEAPEQTPRGSVVDETDGSTAMPPGAFPTDKPATPLLTAPASPIVRPPLVSNNSASTRSYKLPPTPGTPGAFSIASVPTSDVPAQPAPSAIDTNLSEVDSSEGPRSRPGSEVTQEVPPDHAAATSMEPAHLQPTAQEQMDALAEADAAAARDPPYPAKAEAEQPTSPTVLGASSTDSAPVRPVVRIPRDSPITIGGSPPRPTRSPLRKPSITSYEDRFMPKSGPEGDGRAIIRAAPARTVEAVALERASEPSSDNPSLSPEPMEESAAKTPVAGPSRFHEDMSSDVEPIAGSEQAQPRMPAQPANNESPSTARPPLLPQRSNSSNQMRSNPWSTSRVKQLLGDAMDRIERARAVPPFGGPGTKAQGQSPSQPAQQLLRAESNAGSSSRQSSPSLPVPAPAEQLLAVEREVAPLPRPTPISAEDDITPSRQAAIARRDLLAPANIVPPSDSGTYRHPFNRASRPHYNQTTSFELSPGLPLASTSASGVSRSGDRFRSRTASGDMLAVPEGVELTSGSSYDKDQQVGRERPATIQTMNSADASGLRRPPPMPPPKSTNGVTHGTSSINDARRPFLPRMPTDATESEETTTETSSDSDSESSSVDSASDAAPETPAPYRFYPPKGVPREILRPDGYKRNRLEAEFLNRRKPMGPRDRTAPPPLPPRSTKPTTPQKAVTAAENRQTEEGSRQELGTSAPVEHKPLSPLRIEKQAPAPRMSERPPPPPVPVKAADDLRRDASPWQAGPSRPRMPSGPSVPQLNEVESPAVSGPSRSPIAYEPSTATPTPVVAPPASTARPEAVRNGHPRPSRQDSGAVTPEQIAPAPSPQQEAPAPAPVKVPKRKKEKPPPPEPVGKLNIPVRRDDRPDIEMRSALRNRVLKWRSLTSPTDPETGKRTMRPPKIVPIADADPMFDIVGPSASVVGVPPTVLPAFANAQQLPSTPLIQQRPRPVKVDSNRRSSGHGPAPVAAGHRETERQVSQPGSLPAVPSAPPPVTGPSAAPNNLAPLTRYTDVDVLVDQLAGTGQEYEGLAQIEDFLGPEIPRGASPDRLSNLMIGRVDVESRRQTANGKVKLKLTALGVRVVSCPVCLRNYKEGDLIAILPNCGHVSHQGCAVKWLTRDSRCMVCREPL